MQGFVRKVGIFTFEISALKRERKTEDQIPAGKEKRAVVSKQYI